VHDALRDDGRAVDRRADVRGPADPRLRAVLALIPLVYGACVPRGRWRRAHVRRGGEHVLARATAARSPATGRMNATATRASARRSVASRRTCRRMRGGRRAGGTWLA